MISNQEKINIIENKIAYFQEVYDANLINIANPDTITSESDYQMDRCIEIKNDLEVKINALFEEKRLLTIL